MNQFIKSAVGLAILSLSILSCDTETSDSDAKSGYYVLLKAVPTAKADTTKSHEIIIDPLPWGAEVKFHYTKQFEQAYGPYKSGVTIQVIADSPNMDTYVVQAWIKYDKNLDYQLAGEGENNIWFTVPE